jgi:hypothetical protein
VGGFLLNHEDEKNPSAFIVVLKVHQDLKMRGFHGILDLSLT